jgi:hypothetical protein
MRLQIGCSDNASSKRILVRRKLGWSNLLIFLGNNLLLKCVQDSLLMFMHILHSCLSVRTFVIDCNEELEAYSNLNYPQ